MLDTRARVLISLFGDCKSTSFVTPIVNRRLSTTVDGRADADEKSYCFY
uniref:Uncharacterized protein n=1 Tax=Rhizophora mucronata TaxID=61149 RepID=A0A2P2LDH9_RHIMU